MDAYLLSREIGLLSHQKFKDFVSTGQALALQPEIGIKFRSSNGLEGSRRTQEARNIVTEPTNGPQGGQTADLPIAHKAGTNCLEIDRFEGRLMLSGGADPTIHLWNLEQADPAPGSERVLEPIDSVKKCAQSHGFLVAVSNQICTDI
jgi:DNA excision repair protein ERCC-8